MKRKLISLAIFFLLGIGFGGTSMYLVAVVPATNWFVFGNNSTEKFDSQESRSTRRSQLVTEEGGKPNFSLEHTLLQANLFQRRLSIYSHVAELSQQEVTNALATRKRNSMNLSPTVAKELQIALVEKLTSFDPTHALEFVIAHHENLNFYAPYSSIYSNSLEEREIPVIPVVQNIFADWTAYDLKSAISAAKLLSRDTKGNALTGILNSIDGDSFDTRRLIANELGYEHQIVDYVINSILTGKIDDPQAVWEGVVTLIDANNQTHSQALWRIALQWYEQVGFSVLEKIRSSALNETSKSWVIRQLLSEVAAHKPSKAFQFALTLPRKSRYSAEISAVIRQWSRSDPKAAFEAMSLIEKSGERLHFQEKVASTWASQDPSSVLDKLEMFTPKVRKVVINTAIESIARTSPRDAAELVVQFDENWDDSLRNKVMQYWVKLDAEAAIDWVFIRIKTAENRYDWVRALTSYLVRTDPHRAFNVALQQQNFEELRLGFGRYQLGLEAEVINRLTRQDIELAVELLPRVREGKTQIEAYTRVARFFIKKGDTKRAINLGLQLSNSTQSDYYRILSEHWAEVDSGGLVDAIQDFPTDEIRRTVVSNLLSSTWYRNNFTTIQQDQLKQFMTGSDTPP